MARATVAVHVWNQALGCIHHSQFIQNETAATPEVEACSLYWEDAIEACLERYAWPFARKQSTLSTPDGVSRNGWEYVYTLPADCVTPLALLPEDTHLDETPIDDRIPFAVMVNDAGDGLLLCSNADQSAEDFAVLEYTSRVVLPRLWPRLFLEAVVWWLASKLANVLPKDPAKAAACMQAHEAAIRAAVAGSDNARQRDPEPATPYMSARG